MNVWFAFSLYQLKVYADSSLLPWTLTVTLIQPASKWMHWATQRHNSDLFRAATSASSQVIPILNKSLLTVLLQLVHRWPGLLLNPGTSQCNACRGMRCWSIHITSKPAESSFTEYVIRTALSGSDSDLFVYVCYSVLPGNAQDAPLPSMMSGVQSFR